MDKHDTSSDGLFLIFFFVTFEREKRVKARKIKVGEKGQREHKQHKIKIQQ